LPWLPTVRPGPSATLRTGSRQHLEPEILLVDESLPWVKQRVLTGGGVTYSVVSVAKVR